MELSATSEVRRPWWTLTLLVFLLIMSLMDRIILSLLVQPLRDTFQISDVQFGLLFGTSFAILYGLLGFPAARLADTKNRKRLAFCGAILWAGCTAASGFAQSYEQLLLLRAGLAIGEATIFPAAHSLVSDLFPRERRSLAASVVAAAPFLGTAVTYMGGGVLIQAIDSFVAGGGGHGLETWRITLIVVSLPTILFGVLFAATVVEPLRRREVAIIGGKPATADLKSMVPFILPLVIGAGAPMILAAGYAAWAPETLMTEYGLSLGSAGAWFGVVAAVGPVVGSILLPALVNRPKGRPFVEAFLLVCTAAVIIGTAIFIASPLQSSAWILLSGYLVGSILLFGVYSTVIVSMQFIAPEGVRATLVACTTFIGSGLALSIGPPLVGFLKENVTGGYTNALVWTAILSGSISLAALAVARKTARSWQGPDGR